MAGVAAAIVTVGGCGLLPSDPVDPAAELPVFVRFFHGQGGEDQLVIGPDGAVLGWLSAQDGDRPVGCVASARFVSDIARAAANELEPGTTEGPADGADFERLEVTGRHGNAWLANGPNEAVRQANLLLREVHLPDAERTFCRAMPQPSPGAATVTGLSARSHGSQLDLVVTPTGEVTGRTEAGLVSCRVPDATAELLTTAPVPHVDLPPAAADVATSLRRGTTTYDLAPTGTDPLTLAARALVDSLMLTPGERTVCRPAPSSTPAS